MRQDPNIIVVGEMRDSETAGLATQSALTGHLVLSTLHTNDAIGVIPRLINMGVEPYLIPSALNVALAQRLVKRLCSDCKKEIEPSERIKKIILDVVESMPEPSRPKIKKEGFKICKAQGCPKCNNKGTKGRIAVFEILEMTPQLEAIVISEPTESKILAESQRQGMITMFQDGITKVLEGIIGFEELVQVVSITNDDSPAKDEPATGGK